MPAAIGFSGCCGAGIMYSVKVKPNEPELQRILSHAKAHNWGVITFIDNNQTQILAHLDSKANRYIQDDVPKNAGKEWCEFIRSKGYRCDSIWLGGNPNHGEKEPHVLTMYIWYVNKQKDTESVTIEQQDKRKVESVAPPPNPYSMFGAISGFGTGGLGF